MCYNHFRQASQPIRRHVQQENLSTEDGVDPNTSSLSFYKSLQLLPPNAIQVCEDRSTTCIVSVCSYLVPIMINNEEDITDIYTLWVQYFASVIIVDRYSTSSIVPVVHICNN